MQLFDHFTTGDEISAQSPLQPLQCGGSAVNDAHEAREYLAIVTKRCVDKSLLKWIILLQPEFFFNSSEFYAYLHTCRLVILSLLIALVQNLVGAEMLDIGNFYCDV